MWDRKQRGPTIRRSLSITLEFFLDIHNIHKVYNYLNKHIKHYETYVAFIMIVAAIVLFSSIAAQIIFAYKFPKPVILTSFIMIFWTAWIGHIQICTNQLNKQNLKMTKEDNKFLKFKYYMNNFFSLIFTFFMFLICLISTLSAMRII